MGFEANIIADSINETGNRITSFVLRYPRMIHSEIMTHRSVAKSSSSSRAIPIQKMLHDVYYEPAGPVWWGKNQSGMQANEKLTGWRKSVSDWIWFKARFIMLAVVWVLWKVGLHKQISNRLLEQWMWITVIATATDWSNLFALRCHPAAQPEFQKLARMMRLALAKSDPVKLKTGHWHLPFVRVSEIADNTRYDSTGAVEEIDWGYLCKLSVGRSCRVSYLTHDGRKDPAEDILLAGRISENGHFGALDHAAQAVYGNERHGHLVGWKPYRKTFENESDFGLSGALAKVKAHPVMVGKDASKVSLWVGKRVASRWSFLLLTGEPLTATRCGLGSGELPDMFYVVLVADPDLDAASLTVNRPAFGTPVHVFLVTVPGLPFDMEPPMHHFTARTDFCGYRKVGA